METPTQPVYTTPSNGNLTASSRPAAADGTVIFVKEAEPQAPVDANTTTTTFVPLFHNHSVTLRDLAEEYNISSVLECDANGAVQPRAVAFDSPSDVLHSGRHYIVRRDAKGEDGVNRVTFRGKILIKEYDLDHHSTPSNSLVSVSSSGGGSSHGKFAPGTPFIGNRFRSHSNAGSGDGNEEEDTVPRDEQHIANGRSESTAAADAVKGSSFANNAPSQGLFPVVSSSQEGGGTHADADKENVAAVLGCKRARDDAGDEEGEANNRTVGEIPLSDRTNTLPALSGGKASAALRFLPFQADLHGTGSEVTVQLSDLAKLCAGVEALEARNAKRHAEAEECFESVRRLLFAVSKK